MSEEKVKEGQKIELIELKLNYYSDKSDKLLAYYSFLQEHIKRGDKIPARVLKRFIAIFEEPALIHDDLISLQKKFLIAKTIHFFSKIDGYLFKKTIMVSHKDYNDIPVQKKDLYEKEYSFHDMIAQAYNMVSFQEVPKTLKEKRDFARKIYKHIDGYISKKFTKKKYTIYRRMVVTAYISAQFGVLKTEEQYNDSDYTAYLQGLKTYSLISLTVKLSLLL
jgi:hypothetical protein